MKRAHGRPPASDVIVERRRSRPVTYSTCIDSAHVRRDATPARRRARRAVAGVPYGAHQPWTVPTASVYATAGELLDADDRQGSTRLVPASPNGREHDR